jgi:hypothetical protein
MNLIVDLLQDSDIGLLNIYRRMAVATGNRELISLIDFFITAI